MKQPNILFAFADDWGRYASAYAGIEGDNSINAILNTPNFDRVAAEGALFTNACVPAPTCTPCRSSVLSGRYFWQTGLGAILSGAVWDRKVPSYPFLLRDRGYHIGFSYKVWGPGTPPNDPYGGADTRYQDSGADFGQFSFKATELVEKGKSVEEAKAVLYNEALGNFESFLDDRQEDQPFCYWWGPTNTHRLWQKGSGKALWGLEPDDLKDRLPDFLPDVHEVREDVADYLGEAMAYDSGLGVLLDKLEDMGELDNTLVVVSGDHGIPGFPRAKCNLYNIGCEVALAARLPGMIKPGRTIDDMVNLMDLAPTFLEAGGADLPDFMPAQSLMPLLTSDKSGQVEPERDHIITGRERHVATARDKNLPYPQRAIRTHKYHYIRNYAPDRWPMGDPKGLDNPDTAPPSFEDLELKTRAAYADLDASPTKAWMIYHRADEDMKAIYGLGFGKRPAEELYDLEADPCYMNNVADDKSYAEIKKDLSEKLTAELIAQQDPRILEKDCRYENSPYTDGPEQFKDDRAEERKGNAGSIPE